MNDDFRKINWNQLLKTYNRMYSKNYKTPREMLKKLYAQEKTLEKVGEVLGYSAQTIHKYMKEWNLSRLPKGHRAPTPCLKALLALGNDIVSTRGSKEIAKIVGFSRIRVTTLLKKHNIRYCKLKNV